MFNEEWLAKIGYKLPNGRYKISTGVPISAKLLLTAGHGVPEVNKTVVCKFAIDIKKSAPERIAKVVWKGPKNLDVALLQLQDLEHFIRPAIYFGNKPKINVEWWGGGFPAAGEISASDNKKISDTEGTGGTVNSLGGGVSGLLNLSINTGPKRLEDWKGISGGPVFVGEKLIGVISKVPVEFDGKKFHAVSIEKLLKDPEFNKWIKKDHSLDTLKRSRERVLKCLSQHIIELLCDALDIDPPIDADTMVDRLLMFQLQEFVDSCYNVFNDCGKEEDKELVVEILEAGLPVLHDWGQFHFSKTGIVEETVLPLPVVTHTMAEIIMASADGRPTDYCKPNINDDYPVGNPLVQGFTESGILLGKSDFDQHMTNRFLKPSDKKYDEKFRLPLINNTLKFYRTKNPNKYPYRYYVILSGKEKSIANYKKDYPELVFISLDGEQEEIIPEQNIALTLFEIFSGVKREKERHGAA